MKSIIILMIIFACINCKCAYTQPPSGLPYPYDGEAFPMNYTYQMCKDYIGEKVCCNEANAKLTADNFKQLDGAFKGAAGGCDICAINLKRLWCQYACSPRQSEFLKVSSDYYVYPDPQKPGSTIVAQEANLTIEASTACALYESCKRVPFVTSVSAMSNPAGFLSFQGHNAINNALQYINVYFTYNKSEGLYFSDDSGRESTAAVTACNYKGTQLHGFEIEQNCSCNNCEQSCDPNDGFQYHESSVFEGFNAPLVSGFYGFTIVITLLVTYWRYRNTKKKEE